MPIIGHTISPGTTLLVLSSFLAKSYWRVLIFSGGSGTTGAAEVNFKKDGSVKPGKTPISSGGTPANAFDGNNSTNWTITGEFGEYVGLEFAGETEIDEVEIISLLTTFTDTLLDYAVQFSDDGIVWVTMWESRGNVKPTGSGQSTSSGRPFVINDGAAVVSQRTAVILGASADAMINKQKTVAVLGSGTEATVNRIQLYAIYDTGS
jgi:hypothetical protein